MDAIAIILCKNYAYAFDSLVIKYIPPDATLLGDLKNKMGNGYSYLYFRLFYFFYIVIKYVLQEENNNNLNTIFEQYMSCFKSELPLYKNIVAEFVNNYDYLYNIFFVTENVYLCAYFNNLIKHFLPLPYQYLLYCPVITFRAGVDTLYKKNDIDYLEKIEPVDTMERKRFVGVKNVDKVRAEMDVHIPLKYYKSNNFQRTGFVFLVAIKIDNGEYKLIIANKCVINKQVSIENVEYERRFTGYDTAKFEDGYPFQLLVENWVIGPNKYIFDVSQVVYLSVMRSIQKDELFNVFSKMSLPKSDYKYLFHNTEYALTPKNMEHIYTNPTFFYFVPQGAETWAEKYFKDRKCVIFKVNSDVDDILDLTESIITSNPFVDYANIKAEHSKTLWKGDDLSKIMDYYDGKKIPTKIHKHYRCVSTDKSKDISTFVKTRPYCDIGGTKYYVGRRKLYEIYFKTRKYDAASIWPPDYLINTLLPMDVNTCNYIITMFYKTRSILPDVAGCEYVKENEYYDSDVITYLYDAFLLKKGGYPGFFFTDYHVAFSYGGELMLTTPGDHIKSYKNFDKTCDKKGGGEKYAYVALLMGNSAYFLGALVLGYSLKTVHVSSNIDTIIMVTPDVPPSQIKVLEIYYDRVIMIEFVTINPKLIHDYSNNRFKDVFTKLQCLKLVDYKKIIMLDIDMLVIRNMDKLFELPAPAATFRKADLLHGKLIPSHLIVQGKRLISGINAGLMLLEPNVKEYDAIMADLIKSTNNSEYKNPEQDYLSYRYANKWTNISFLYNFQFGLTNRATKFNTDEIYNLHYSSRLKPWRLLTKYEETLAWIEENPVNVPYYKLWMETFDTVRDRCSLDDMFITKLFSH